jgi:hypothetical protein
MPFRKFRLTRAEQDEHFDIAQSLRAQGLDIEIPEEWEKQSNRLEILISADSTIYELRPGLTLYAIYVRLISWRNGLAVEDFDISPAWDDGVMACSTEDEIYRFGRGLDFDRPQVLNHQLEARLRFPHIGGRIEGWLLGTGWRPLPAEYGPGHPAPFELSFLDQLCRSHSTRAVAMVHRSTKTREMHVRRDSLFERERSSSSAAYTQREAGVLHDFSKDEVSVKSFVAETTETSFLPKKTLRTNTPGVRRRTGAV